MRPAAGLALAYAAACLLLALLLAARWLQDRPLTSPLQLVDPRLTLLVPGEAVEIPGLAEPLVVTEVLARTAAAAHLLVFGSAGLLWGAAGIGLLGRRRWARGLALALLAATVGVGFLNLGVAGVLLALGGGLEALAGGLPVLAATLVLLVLLPAGAAALLLAPATAARFQGPAGAGPGLLRAGLALHFLLLGGLLAGAALMPRSLAEPVILIGPWSLGGAPARLLSGLLGLPHLIAGAGLIRRLPWAGEAAWWLTAGLTGLAAAAWLTAGEGALTRAGGGLLPPAVVRGLLGLVAVLGGGLLWSLRRLRSGPPSPARGPQAGSPGDVSPPGPSR